MKDCANVYQKYAKDEEAKKKFSIQLRHYNTIILPAKVLGEYIATRSIKNASCSFDFRQMGISQLTNN